MMSGAKAEKVNVVMADDDLLIDPVWPGACPASGGIGGVGTSSSNSATGSIAGGGGGSGSEQHIITIVCGNQRLSWALHSQQQYSPTLFWQTTPILANEFPRRSLYELIPPHVRTIFYGPKIKSSTTISSDTPVATSDVTPSFEISNPQHNLETVHSAVVENAKTEADARQVHQTDSDLNSESKTADNMEDEDRKVAATTPQIDTKSFDTPIVAGSETMEIDNPSKVVTNEVPAENNRYQAVIDDDLKGLNIAANDAESILGDIIQNTNEDPAQNVNTEAPKIHDDSKDISVDKGSLEYQDSVKIIDSNDEQTLKKEEEQDSTKIRKLGRPRKHPTIDDTASLIDESLLDDSVFYTTKRAVRYRSTFRIPAISIYIVSTNVVHPKGIATLFRNIPCRLFHLSSDDFVIPTTVSSAKSSSNQKASNSGGADSTNSSNDCTNMNVDRICLLEGARYLYSPQKAFLLFDTGSTSTMTYTATDRTGRLLGGGIGPSISMKFRSYNDYSMWALPHIWRTTVVQHIDKCKEGLKPESVHSSDGNTLVQSTSPITMEDALIRSVLKETILSMSNVIKGWMDCVQISGTGKTKKVQSKTIKSTATTYPPMLLISGTDAEIFRMLLQPKHSGLCDSSDNSDAIAQYIENAISSEQLKVSFAKKNSPSLIAHHGIQYMLLQQEQVKKAMIKTSRTASTIEDVRDTLLGQRVAHILDLSDKVLGSIIADITDIPRRANFIYGSVIHVFRHSQDDDDNKKGNNKSSSGVSGLESDYYSIFWDESCTIDDVTPSELYDYLVLYSKANEAEEEFDLGRKKRLEEKMVEAKNASVLLAQNSIGVRNIIQSRLPPSSPFPPSLAPKNAAPITSSAKLSKGAGSLTTSKSSSAKKSISNAFEPKSSSKMGRPKKHTSAKSVPPPKSLSKPKYTSAKSIPPYSTSSKRKKEDDDLSLDDNDDDDQFIASDRRSKRQRRVSYKEDVISPSPTISTKKSKRASRETDGISLSSSKVGKSSHTKKSSKDETDPYLKRRIAKEFDGDIYFGFVKVYTPAKDNDEGTDLWGIEYDDGDAEDFEEDELMNGFLLYRKHSTKDTVGNAAKRSSFKK